MKSFKLAVRTFLRIALPYFRSEQRWQARALLLGGIGADIVFLDPPYALEGEYETALTKLGARPPKLVIVQHDVRRKLEPAYGTLSQTRVLRQGDNCLSFYAQ